MGTVQGQIVAQINGDSTLATLLPGKAWAGEEPAETPNPPACIVAAKQTPPEWITSTSRKEFHNVKVLVYAGAATTVGAPNPAVLIADNIERVINWQSLGLANTLTMGVKRGERTPALEVKKSPSGERVWKITLEWAAVLWVNGTQV